MSKQAGHSAVCDQNPTVTHLAASKIIEGSLNLFSIKRIHLDYGFDAMSRRKLQHDAVGGSRCHKATLDTVTTQ